jgi:gluconate 2-dehydrogenase alpha chain
MAQELKKTDVVIVGLGAGGGIAAYALTEAGLNVVGLEAGGRLTGRDEQLNELADSFNFNIWGRPKANYEVPTWRPNASTPTVRASAHAASNSGIMMNAVGGSSIHYGCESWRLVPWNFKMRSEAIKRYGANIIPAGSTLADWPLTYEELEPYYDKVEYGIGISGKAGNIRGKIDPAGNIFEGPRSREFPLPPLRRSGFNDLMAEAARRLGWHPFPEPSSVHSQMFKGKPACTYCSSCLEGCFIGAKGSTNMDMIPAAEATRRLLVVTQARVTHVKTDNNGRVTGVLFLKGGKEFFQPASVVMLAAYNYENNRLLLLSTSKAYPKGLSNNHGQVGRHYMPHNVGQTSFALFPGRKLNRWGSAGGQCTAVDDWADDNFDHSGLGFLGGGVIKPGMGAMPIGAANTLPPSVPRWGSAWKSWVKANANSVASGNSQGDGLSYEDHYLDLDPVTRDPLGFPVIRITFDLKDYEKRHADFEAEKIALWFKEAGASETWTTPTRAVALSQHAYGGTRMGTDPETNVVDRWCFSHEAPNLALIGGSTFPTAGGRNPTLTIQALAWWTADHLVKNWKSIAV